MKRALLTAVLISFVMGASAISSLAASEHGGHHPGKAQSTATASTPGMMGHQGMGQGPCMTPPSSDSMSHMMDKRMGAGMSHMMGGGKMGMMEQRMAHMFFLDRVEDLGLSTEQVSKLKAIHSDCRKDNIRNAAESKIVKLELGDLLAGDDWSLTEAESLVRKARKLDGDIQVRHLQALTDARKLLTPEQLKQARSDDVASNLENLF